jgi:hypothetical protein
MPCPTVVALKGLAVLAGSLWSGRIGMRTFGDGVVSGATTIYHHATGNISGTVDDLEPLFDAIGGAEEIGVNVEAYGVPVWQEDLERHERRRLSAPTPEAVTWAFLDSLSSSDLQAFYSSEPWYDPTHPKPCNMVVEPLPVFDYQDPRTRECCRIVDWPAGWRSEVELATWRETRPDANGWYVPGKRIHRHAPGRRLAEQPQHLVHQHTPALRHTPPLPSHRHTPALPQGLREGLREQGAASGRALSHNGVHEAVRPEGPLAYRNFYAAYRVAGQNLCCCCVPRTGLGFFYRCCSDEIVFRAWPPSDPPLNPSDPPLPGYDTWEVRL